MSWSLRVRTAIGSTSCAATYTLFIRNMPAVFKRYLRNWTIPVVDKTNASVSPGGNPRFAASGRPGCYSLATSRSDPIATVTDEPMSEYQYIAFRAIDGPVSKKDLVHMRHQSTRRGHALVICNEYSFGDL